MKNKTKVPKKLPNPKEVSLPELPTAQWVEQSTAAERCRDLEAIKDIMSFFQSPGPSVIDCEDIGYRAYLIAAALAEFQGLAVTGLEAEGSSLSHTVMQYAADGLRLQLQIARLAAKTLFELCDPRLQPKISAPSIASR
jgi:hypothetical protein